MTSETVASPPPRSNSPPTQTFHPSPSLSLPSMPQPTSAAAGAHYSGARTFHKRSSVVRASFASVEGVGDLDDSHRQLMEDMKELYECRPTLEIFDRSWAYDAVLEDSFTHCKGSEEIMSKWFAMPKLFSSSMTVARRVLSSPEDATHLVYSQTQEYVVRLLNIKKTIRSMIVIDLNQEGKIIRLEDQWNGQQPPTNWGTIYLRRLSAKLTPWLVKVPKQSQKAD